MATQLTADGRRPIHHATCGCCSAGCICTNHQDVPRGYPVHACAYHAALPVAPLDRGFRYDASLREYIRVPEAR